MFLLYATCTVTTCAYQDRTCTKVLSLSHVAQNYASRWSGVHFPPLDAQSFSPKRRALLYPRMFLPQAPCLFLPHVKSVVLKHVVARNISSPVCNVHFHNMSQHELPGIAHLKTVGLKPCHSKTCFSHRRRALLRHEHELPGVAHVQNCIF